MFSDTKKEPFKRFKSFMNLLSIEEKLFFLLVINFKKNNKKAQEIFEKLNKREGNNELLEELLNIDSTERKTKEKELEEMINAYLNNNIQYIEEKFEKMIGFLYGVRSIIVHFGKPVIGGITSSSGEIIEHYGEKEDIFFTIKYPIGNFFIRALYRYNHIEPKNIVWEIENYCFDKLSPQYCGFFSKFIYFIKKKYKIN